LLTNRKLFSLNNRHSPHSLASVKDMYVEMAFQLNLYRHSQAVIIPILRLPDSFHD
jgi:hypothetical protein